MYPIDQFDTLNSCDNQVISLVDPSIKQFNLTKYQYWQTILYHSDISAFFNVSLNQYLCPIINYTILDSQQAVVSSAVESNPPGLYSTLNLGGYNAYNGYLQVYTHYTPPTFSRHYNLTFFIRADTRKGTPSAVKQIDLVFGCFSNSYISYSANYTSLNDPMTRQVYLNGTYLMKMYTRRGIPNNATDAIRTVNFTHYFDFRAYPTSNCHPSRLDFCNDSLCNVTLPPESPVKLAQQPTLQDFATGTISP